MSLLGCSLGWIFCEGYEEWDWMDGRKLIGDTLGCLGMIKVLWFVLFGVIVYPLLSEFESRENLRELLLLLPQFSHISSILLRRNIADSEFA